MKTKTFRIFSAVLLSLLLMLPLSPAAVSAFAANAHTPDLPRVNDMADLFDAAAEAQLLRNLDAASEEFAFDIVVVTTDDLGRKSAKAYADDFFDNNGFGFGYGDNRDGALLLISVEPGKRKVYISTCGRGLRYLYDDRIDRMLDAMVDKHLSKKGYEDYAGAANTFFNYCVDYLSKPAPVLDTDAASGKASFGRYMLLSLLISLGGGLAVGGIYLLILCFKMKSVRKQAEANSYIDTPLQLSHSSDIFLYKDVKRYKIERSSNSGRDGHHSSSHSSSSGSSHGGGGRSF